MQVYQDLEIYGNKEDLLKFVELVTDSLDENWNRGKELEDDIKSSSVGDSILFCFIFNDPEKRDLYSSLWLALSGNNKLYVSNIVPKERGKLAYAEYNEIMNTFYTNFVKDLSQQVGLECKISSGIQSIKDWLSPEVAKKLEIFSALANKSTGSAHPSDQKRWFDFIVSCHKEKCDLDVYRLQRWLIEEENWPEDNAVELTIEYEFSTALLSFYDEY